MISDRAIRAALERFRLASPETSEATHFEIILDASLSMTSGDGSKEQLTRELAIFLLRAAEAAGVPARLFAVKGDDRDREFDAVDFGRVALFAFDGDRPLDTALEKLACLLATSAGEGRWRVAISDLLFPADPTSFVRRIAQNASRVWLVQLLDDAELLPVPAGRVALQDLETDQSVEVVLDESAIAGYRTRLADLIEGIRVSCHEANVSFVSVSAAVGLEHLCRDSLAKAGLLAEYPVTTKTEPSI